MKKEQKSAIFNQKTLILTTIIGFGVAVSMVYIFGKLAPIAIVSYRLVSQLVRPLFS